MFHVVLPRYLSCRQKNACLPLPESRRLCLMESLMILMSMFCLVFTEHTLCHVKISQKKQ
ncbi:hypothetical protein D777_03108 [Marinobacter nitratireducens]|uniref:Uncharacterized protein n=1 Tax=Marinobacter nitratireducens TaxID=1137280 RepID=A0A072MY58_9GAMM|nr:hypothetical protein D777_03108 [Marinobacter nitratireducens]